MTRRAFTLVEVTVAFAIALMAFLLLVSTYGDYTQLYRHQDETMTSARDAQVFLSTFKDEIRGRSASGLGLENISTETIKLLGYPGSPLQFWKEEHVVGFHIVRYNAYEGGVVWTQRCLLMRRVKEVMGPDGQAGFEPILPGKFDPPLKDPELEKAFTSLGTGCWRYVPWPSRENPKISFFVVKRQLELYGEATVTYAYYHKDGLPFPKGTLCRVATDLIPGLSPDLRPGERKIVVIQIGEGRIGPDFLPLPTNEVAVWPLPNQTVPYFVVTKRRVDVHASFVEAAGGRHARRTLSFDMSLPANL